MSIIITGAQGFLGAELVSAFQSKNCAVLALTRKNCDLSSLKQTKKYFSSIQSSLIIHCAAFVPKSLTEYEDKVLSKNNSLILKNILAVTSCPIIYISSMTIYGPSSNIVRDEEEQPNPQSAYAVSKYQGEECLKKSKQDSLILRIPGLFGEKRRNGLIYNTIQQLLKSTALTLPEQPILWAAMDVKDAADCIIKIVKNHVFNGFDVINVGYDEIYSLNKLISIYENIENIEINYPIQHPEFKFSLKKLNKLNAVPKSTISSAIIKLRSQLC